MTTTATRTRATERDHSIGDPTARLAAIGFGVVLAVALPLILYLGRHVWFFGDDWRFLARDGGDLRDLLEPVHVHWSTFTIVAFRMLYRIFGLRTYLPYQACLVVLHLTAAVLLRVVMRRAGVSPWIATIAASMFVLFGTGYQNILWPSVIGFVGSVVFGLVHLLLTDHDGPIDRRDWLGLVAGAAGLMSSGVGVSMVVVVALATLIRRGWRVALLHSVPLGALYVVWWFGFADDAVRPEAGSPDLWARFAWHGIAATFEGLGQSPGIGLALGAVLVVGLVLAWTGRLTGVERRRQAAMPAALLVGAPVFLLISGSARAAIFGTDYGRASRYTHLVAAMTLPAIAVAADAIARRGRLLAMAVVVLLLVGIPGNIDALAHPGSLFRRAFHDPNRRLILALPRVPAAADVPQTIVPYPTPEITIGWLRDAVASGRLPDPGELSPTEIADTTLALVIVQEADDDDQICRGPTVVPERTVELARGEAIRLFGAAVNVALVSTDGSESRLHTYNVARDQTLRALTGPVTLHLLPVGGTQAVVLCPSADHGLQR